MKASDRITLVSLIVALSQQKSELAPNLKARLTELTEQPTLDFNQLHRLGTQEPFRTTYFEMRQVCQKNAGERGKGDLPDMSDEDDSDSNLLVNYLNVSEEQDGQTLEESLRDIGRADKAIARAKLYVRTWFIG